MMFTESPYCARLTADQILSRKVVFLSKKPSEGLYSFSPLICIGQWLSVTSGVSGRFDIDAIFVSPSGRVAFILPSEMIGDKLSSIMDELSTWDYETLDRIAEDFSYSVMGQAFSVSDLMAKHGHITFAQVDLLNESMTNCMQSGSFSMLGIADSEFDNLD